MRRTNLFIVLGVAASLMVTHQVAATLLYGHAGWDYTGLYLIDTVAQTATQVGEDPVRDGSGPDIQMSPDNATIYMSRAGWWDDELDESLYLIDPRTGLNTGTLALSNFPGATDTPTALEFVGSTLYASFSLAGPEVNSGILGTIDLDTGAITEIGTMEDMDRPTGGLDYVDGTMYAVSSTDNDDSRLFTIDLVTGAATLVGALTLDGVQKEGATALAYADGVMYTLLTDGKEQDSNLYSIDLSTGALTLEFDMGVTLNSLTKPVHEPATILLFGSGAAGFAVFRRKRKKR